MAQQAAAASHQRQTTAGGTAAPAETGSPATAAGQFASENEARDHCRGGTVVWVNTKTHVYHLAGSNAFGHTKHGAFMCQADADRGGRLHAAKNEAAPTGGSGGSTAPRTQRSR